MVHTKISRNQCDIKWFSGQVAIGSQLAEDYFNSECLIGNIIATIVEKPIGHIIIFIQIIVGRYVICM